MCLPAGLLLVVNRMIGHFWGTRENRAVVCPSRVEPTSSYHNVSLKGTTSCCCALLYTNKINVLINQSIEVLLLPVLSLIKLVRQMNIIMRVQWQVWNIWFFKINVRFQNPAPELQRGWTSEIILYQWVASSPNSKESLVQSLSKDLSCLLGKFRLLIFLPAVSCIWVVFKNRTRDIAHLPFVSVTEVIQKESVILNWMREYNVNTYFGPGERWQIH